MIDYQKAKVLAGDADPETRRRLAERADLQPEILYFLAEDSEPAVRATIAANAATPRQADLMLAKDQDEGVRERLAHKIGRLAPNLSGEEKEHIRELTLDVIAILAADRQARVRQIIAESLKDMVDAPVEVIRRLARDVEIRVAGPILESSPLLSDDELVEIIQSKPIQGALEAIARRRRLGMRLSEALVTSAVSAPDGVLAVALLLKNHNAEIDAATMEQILDLAPQYGSWHEPLVDRPALPGMVLRRLVSFVSEHLLGVLKKKSEADPEMAAVVAEAVQRRLAEEAAAADDVEVENPPIGTKAILAAIEVGDINAVATAVARDSGLQRAIVRRIFASASPKAISSLAWKANYPMALAVALQTGPGHIPPQQVLQAAEGVESYPLSHDDMEWQLELFGEPTGPVSRSGARRAASA